MTYKYTHDVKFCYTCRSHFHAPPVVHEEAEHPDGEWLFREGKAEPEEQYP